MAYQVRRRDPLFDRGTQAVIERRGKELLGLCLLLLAIAGALVLGSYSPEDPSWLAASDEPVHNLLGRFGASVAQTAFVILGWGCWVLPLACALWAGRFLLHKGEENVPGRSLLTPVAVVVTSAFAASHVPGEAWTHSFGMGGLLGDTILGAMLSALPLGSAFGLKVLSVLLAAMTVASVLFVLGFTRFEMRRIGQFLLIGTIMTYAALVRVGGQTLALLWAGGRAASGEAARRLAGWRSARAEASAGHEDASAGPDRAGWQAARRHEGTHGMVPAGAPGGEAARPVIARMPGASRLPDEAPAAQHAIREPAARTAARTATHEALPATGAAERPSLLSRVPSFLKRQAPAAAAPVPDVDAPDAAADPIGARIARVISDRMRRAGVPQARAEPPVERPKGPRPILFDKNYYPAGGPPVRRGSDAGEAAPATPEDEDAFARPHRPLTAEPLFETDDDMPGEAIRAALPAAGIPDSRKVVQSLQKRPLFPSRQAQAEAQPGLAFDDRVPGYEPPPLSLLTDPASVQRHHLSEDALGENARLLESVLDDYGVKGEIVSVRPGPVVTMYELEPAPGLKASRVIGLADDIARSMEALSARVSTVPGRSVIGIELPNQQREKVVLREILASRDFGDTNMRLPLALGKDIGGAAVVANLAKMPHLLIAGTTGSGKSVAINTMILSLLYKLTPDECRLIMIDPKMLELSVYDGIPHLLSPVVTDPKKAVVALKWVVGEMEERYRKMSRMGVRNIEGYNDRVRDALSRNEMFSRTVQTGFDDETGEPTFETDEFRPEVLPFIVVVVDEMADLMMVAGKEIEACIQRLAQMARASGIHLIMATQRPSVDVITGTIKANFPTRISFQVTSKIDSRTILGEMGAEQLLGMGDMLYMAGGGRIGRVHGPFVSDEEVEEIVNHLKSFGPPSYVGGVIEGPENDDRETSIDEVLGLSTGAEGDEALYDMAVAIVAKDRKCSTSYIQRKLAIGYNKAARLVETMETNGVVSSANQVGKREVLVPEPQ